MKKSEIKVGGLYTAKVSEKLVMVRVDEIVTSSNLKSKVRENVYGRKTLRDVTTYLVTNLSTGRQVTFRSAARFRKEVKSKPEAIKANSPVAQTVDPKPSLADRIKAKESKVENGPPHLIIRAKAGTGKTTTLVEGLRYILGGESNLTPTDQQRAIWEEMAKSKGARNIGFVAYNKSIATELQRRVPAGVQAMTMHSLGLRTIRNTFNLTVGNNGISEYRVCDIIQELLEVDIRQLRKTAPILIQATERLVGFCKQNLVDLEGSSSESEETWEKLQNLADHYEVDLRSEDGKDRRAEIFDLVPRVLERCANLSADRCVDFNDMIWLPVRLKLPVCRYDVLLVDECVPGWTPVMLADGRSVTIQEIVESKEEFKVRAYDTRKGRPKNCRVIGKQKILNQKPLVKVKVKHFHLTGTNRKTNFVICTEDHKVWTINRGWVPAGNLRRGDDVIIETAAKTTQKGKVTQKGREKLSSILVGNNRGLGNRGGDPDMFNSIKGGNGRGLTLAERTLFEALGFGWKPLVVRTGDAPQFGRGDKPSHYKIDIAEPNLKIAVEVDGDSHRGNERIDAKKQAFLESRGWTVIRVSNRDAIQRTSSEVARIIALANKIGTLNCPRPARVISVDSVRIPDNYVYDITVEDCHNFYANGILVHNCQDLNRAQQALAKMSGTRLIFCGDDRQCQPTGTLVSKAGQLGNRWHESIKGEQIPIEELKVGDYLIAYCPKDGRNYSNRTVLDISKRPYDGDLVVVETEDGVKTKYTPEHRCYASFGALRDYYGVYLMKRGPQFRIGSCQINYKASGNGLIHRLRTEGGDSIWLLEVHGTKREARLREMELAYEYNLPQIVFSGDSQGYILDEEGVVRFWDYVGSNASKGLQVLKNFKLE